MEIQTKYWPDPGRQLFSMKTTFSCHEEALFKTKEKLAKIFWSMFLYVHILKLYVFICSYLF